MGKRKGNTMATHAVEATGLRVISMYVQEYFHWGWQPYGQENDDGIDADIIPRYSNGQDMGVRIHVQSKSGPGYLSSINSNTVNIHPYRDKERLNRHVDKWHHFNEPVILIYTNAEKVNGKGDKYLDLKNPTAWWVQMNDYQYDGSTVVRIPRGNLFQEHTKGELVKLIKPYVKDWVHYPQIFPTNTDLKLWNSLSLGADAKAFYKQWANSKPTVRLSRTDKEVKVSRTGWRHITNKARKNRVALSMRLLPIAQIILQHSAKIRPVLLRSRDLHATWNAATEHLGFRSRVMIDGREMKVQVVLKRYRNLRYNKEKIWFYSVHIIK